MPFTEATAHKVLNKILRNTDFTHPTALEVSLHTADPGATGANEVTGGSYARQSVTFEAPVSKTSDNTANLEWTGMPACTVSHVGLWDTEATPNFWWAGSVTVPKTLEAGDAFRVNLGDLDASLT